MYKETLIMPFRVSSSTGLSYMVSLAEESPSTKSITMDEGSIIRIKSRISFPLLLPSSEDSSKKLLWRIDLSVVKQITGSEAKELPKIISKMFIPTTTKTFLDHLKDLDAKYRYEVEVEFVDVIAYDHLSKNISVEKNLSQHDIIRPVDITIVAESILKLANPEYIKEAIIQSELYKVAQYIIKSPSYLMQFQTNGSLKKLLPSVLAITRTDYRDIFPPKNLFITEKADGKRALAIIRNGKAIIISNILIIGNIIANMDKKYQNDTIIDGEYIGGKTPPLPPHKSNNDIDEDEKSNNDIDEDEKSNNDIGSTKLATFYAFDIIVMNGINVSNEGFEIRVGYLDAACILLSDLGINARSKVFTQIIDTAEEELKSVINYVYDMKQPYEKDGLIFVEPGKSYINTLTYKWKPAHDNTIDFLAKRAPTTVLGKLPFIEKPNHKLYFLFVGINNELFESLAIQWCPGYSQIFGKSISGSTGLTAGQGSHRNYFPIQFSPSDVPLAYIYQHPDNSPYEIDGKIIEAKCGGNCGSAGGKGQFVDWEINRIREDREKELLSNHYFGNDYYMAELIWLNYVDPFPIEQLWEGISRDYFMSEKNGIYRAQVGVISFIKNERILSLQNSNWVIDIGIGKGQDLGRYFSAEIHNLIAIDQDKAALSELVRRKYQHAKPKKDNRHIAKKLSTAVYVIVADINHEEPNSILTKCHNLGMETADALVCNLAIHYFMSTTESLTNFIDIVKNSVKIGGQVCITCMFGENIHSLFKKEKIAEGQSWDIHENGILKYSIKRMYSSTNLESVGQRIGIMLPFSIGNYYEEFLVNTKELIELFKSIGFSVQVAATMNKSLSRFQARNGSLYSNLTDDDKFYLSLYGELVFMRKK